MSCGHIVRFVFNGEDFCSDCIKNLRSESETLHNVRQDFAHLESQLRQARSDNEDLAAALGKSERANEQQGRELFDLRAELSTLRASAPGDPEPEGSASSSTTEVNFEYAEAYALGRIKHWAMRWEVGYPYVNNLCRAYLALVSNEGKDAEVARQRVAVLEGVMANWMDAQHGMRMVAQEILNRKAKEEPQKS